MRAVQKPMLALLAGAAVILSCGWAQADDVQPASLPVSPLIDDPLLTNPLLVEDPLHGFCWGTSTCSDNGTVTPVDRSPQFGFAISPGPNTGIFFVDFLVPTNKVSVPSALTYVVKGSQGGIANNQAISATTTLVSSTAWTSGTLTDYLSRPTSPTNPIGGFLPSTQAYDPGATGYYVYEAALGLNKLANVSNGTAGPLLQLGSGGNQILELGSLIVGFLNTGTTSSPNWVSTAQSGALLDVAEPGSLFLLAGGLVMLGGLGCLRRVRASRV